MQELLRSAAIAMLHTKEEEQAVSLFQTVFGQVTLLLTACSMCNLFRGSTGTSCSDWTSYQIAARMNLWQAQLRGLKHKGGLQL